jgi:UDP-N-acetylmuramyl pentapeptide phosphotransferase/UDP-N-acetylglucosamine-1-phosphate transferase
MKLAAVFLTSLMVGLLLQPPLILWLRSRGVLDVPNARSSHTAITPRGGGIAVLVGLAVGVCVGHVGGKDVMVVFIGALCLGVVGLADDIRGLSARLRLGIIACVGALAGSLIGSPLPLLLSPIVMGAWVAAYVNAFNFMDGINGISGLTAFVCGVSYALMGLEFHSVTILVLGAALAGASASFLPYNIPRAKVFLGDVGSYSLGFVIAVVGWMAWAAGAPVALAIAPTAVYLADTGATLVRRFRRGVPLTDAHREHAYQQLAAGGCRHTTVAMYVCVMEIVVTAAVWWGYRAGQAWLGLLAAVSALVVYSIVPRLMSSRARG